MNRLLLAFCTLLACSVFVGESAADDAADIASIADKIMDASNSGKADGIFENMIAEPKVFGLTGRPLWALDKEGMKAAFAAGWINDLEWRDLQIEVHGESAVGTALVDGTVTRPDSSVIQGPWRASNFWVKEAGQWKLAHYHASKLLPDDRGAEAVVARYHRALAENDGETARACLVGTYVQAGQQQGGLTGDPTRWRGRVLDAETINERIEQAIDPATVYTNSLEFLHTSVDEESGSVVTRETGGRSSAGRSGGWEGITNLWWVVKVEGKWKIAGSLHHILGT